MDHVIPVMDHVTPVLIFINHCNNILTHRVVAKLFDSIEKLPVIGFLPVYPSH